MDADQPEPDETPKERADRELIELLNELRVVLPGTTVLLAFLLAVPFAKGWTRVTGFQRDVFVVAFLSTAVSVALLTAPSSYHRLRFRQGNKERIVRIGNRLTIAGIAASAVSLLAVVVLVMDFVVSRNAAIVAAAALFVVIAALWYGLALVAELRDRSAR
jgi:amino acid transporter